MTHSELPGRAQGRNHPELHQVMSLCPVQRPVLPLPHLFLKPIGILQRVLVVMTHRLILLAIKNIVTPMEDRV